MNDNYCRDLLNNIKPIFTEISKSSICKKLLEIRAEFINLIQ